ncbi:MAG: ABC transporter ATP-binding protein, partial [Chloroflexi bacterium]
MSVERRAQQPGGMAGGPMGRGGWGAMGRPVEKPKDFKGTLKRFLVYFVPQKYRLLVVLGAAILGTTFNIVGPKILG